MNDVKHYIDQLQSYIFCYNEYWEDPVEHSMLVETPDKACRQIKAYCDVIKANAEDIGKEYIEHPAIVQGAISKIIEIASDGRELRKPVVFRNIKPSVLERGITERTHDHYVEKNGYLKFENNPMRYVDDIIKNADNVLMLWKSTENTKELDKYLDKIYHFNGYEDGSYIVKIQKIYFKNNEFFFDGNVTELVTMNSGRGDGVLIYEAELFPFNKLPYYNKVNNVKDFMKYMDGIKVMTEDEMKEDIQYAIACALEDVFEIDDFEY